jgi:hypothetical protein
MKSTAIMSIKGRKSEKSGKIAGKVPPGVLMRGAKQNFKYASNELL